MDLEPTAGGRISK